MVGIYAELIQNRGFEDGVPPLNCPYLPMTNQLLTPMDDMHYFFHASGFDSRLEIV